MYIFFYLILIPILHKSLLYHLHYNELRTVLSKIMALQWKCWPVEMIAFLWKSDIFPPLSSTRLINQMCVFLILTYNIIIYYLLYYEINKNSTKLISAVEFNTVVARKVIWTYVPYYYAASLCIKLRNSNNCT